MRPTTLNDKHDEDFDDEEGLSKEEKERLDALNALAASSQELVEEAVIARNASTFRQEILRSFRLYNASTVESLEDLIQEWEGNRTALNNGSKVVQNIIRQLCNDGASQLGDMLFPNDDDNYGLDPVLPSKPPLKIKDELAVNSGGEPLMTLDTETGEERQATNQEAWEARVVLLRAKTERMFQKIDGTLDRIQFGKIGRKCIDDAARTGTGIIKGPFIDPEKDRKWTRDASSGWTLEEDNAQQSTYKTVSVLDFFPDLSAECVEEAAFINERSWYLPRQLRSLKGLGYEDDQIDRLLTYNPKEITSAGGDGDNDRKFVKDAAVDNDNYAKRYEVWETWAEVPVPVLKEAGVKIPERYKDYNAVMACVIHCNGITLKAFVAKQQNVLPYSVWNWDEDPTSIFGKSIAILAENCQLIYNATWRMILDHGGVSAVPMVTRIKDKVKPADGSEDYSIKGGKVWDIVGDAFDLPDGANGRKPFEIHEIPAHLDQFFAVMDKAEEDAYKITGVTRVDKNESNNHPDNAPVTLGATQIFQNNASVSRRRQVRNFDDQITKTVVTRQYNWHMEFDGDDTIKAAMVVEPRGSSVLMQREVNMQNLMQLYQVTQGGAMPGSKGPEMLREIESGMQFPGGRFVETKEETEKRMQLEAENPPVDPEVQLEQMKVDLELEKVNQAGEKAEAEVELKQAELQLQAQVKQAELELKAIDSERAHVREMLRLKLMDKAQAEQSFTALQSKQAEIQVKLEDIQSRRDIEAGKLMEKDEDDRRRSDIEAMNAAAKLQDADTKKRELDNKLAGNIDQGV